MDAKGRYRKELAKALQKMKQTKQTDEDETHNKPGFRFYYGLTARYVTAETYAKSPALNRYIAPEYITSVKPLWSLNNT